jgi:DNA-repair protein XRCC4
VRERSRSWSWSWSRSRSRSRGDNSTDRTEHFEEGSDKEASVNNEPSDTGSGDHYSSPEKSGATSRGRRKRTRK